MVAVAAVVVDVKERKNLNKMREKAQPQIPVRRKKKLEVAESVK